MSYNMEPAMGGHPCLSPEMMRGATAPMYPEIYYKIQPHILMACDEMDMHGCFAPTQEIIMCMCDRICSNLFRVYPEMARYDIEYEPDSRGDHWQASQFGFRRRGPFRDFIAFLLLAELFRRRRWF